MTGTIIVTNRRNTLLGVAIDHTTAELVRIQRPAWIITAAPVEVVPVLMQRETRGFKYQARIIPPRPIKPGPAELVDSPYGIGEVISRDNGFVKFKTATGQVYRLLEEE